MFQKLIALLVLLGIGFVGVLAVGSVMAQTAYSAEAAVPVASYVLMLDGNAKALLIVYSDGVSRVYTNADNPQTVQALYDSVPASGQHIVGFSSRCLPTP